MADKERREGGRSPTKFMERPGSKSEKKKDEDLHRKEESHPGFIEDDLDALERQETYDEEISRSNPGVSKPGHKGDEKRDPRKTDVGPEQGDTAC